jgi:hypothetical protein
LAPSCVTTITSGIIEENKTLFLFLKSFDGATGFVECGGFHIQVVAILAL